MEPAARRLLCSCTPCAILFSHRGGSKYRRVPRRVEDMAHLRLTDMQWEALGLPIALAFFLYSGPAGRMVAVYPSPAGATESALPLETWEELVAENAELRNLEPDVEALLVNRVGAAVQLLPGRHRPVLPARGDSADALARLLRWDEGLARDRTVFRDAQRLVAANGGNGPCLICNSVWNRPRRSARPRHHEWDSVSR